MTFVSRLLSLVDHTMIGLNVNCTVGLVTLGHLADVLVGMVSSYLLQVDNVISVSRSVVFLDNYSLVYTGLDLAVS